MVDPYLMMLSNEIRAYAALLLKFYNQALEQRMQNYGVALGSLQYGVLQMLQFETLTISEISQRMGTDPSSTMRIIDSLERKGLVARGVDPNDRRRNPIRITEEGLGLLVAVPTVSENDSTFQALQSLGTEPAAQLRDNLFALIQQFPEGKLVTELMAGKPGMDKESKGDVQQQR